MVVFLLLILSHSVLIEICFTESDTLISKYKDARENVDMLINLGASIWYRVDATQIKAHPDLWWKKFDRIVYNFPHAGFFGKEDDPNLIM